MRSTYRLARELFSGWIIVMYLLIYMAATTGYFYIISKNAAVSVSVGFISSFILFYTFNIINGKVARKEQELSDLSRYVTSIVFHLKTGKNVLTALEKTREKAGETIHEDIDSTIASIRSTGELNLDSFQRHNFKSLDIFHKILDIRNEKGGDTNELFKNTTKDINFEIGKRDELNQNKKYIAKEEYMMMLITMAIPGILVFMTGDLYNQFLELGLTSILILIVYYGGLITNLVFLQRKRADINVNV